MTTRLSTSRQHILLAISLVMVTLIALFWGAHARAQGTPAPVTIKVLQQVNSSRFPMRYTPFTITQQGSQQVSRYTTDGSGVYIATLQPGSYVIETANPKTKSTMKYGFKVESVGKPLLIEVILQ